MSVPGYAPEVAAAATALALLGGDLSGRMGQRSLFRLAAGGLALALALAWLTPDAPQALGQLRHLPFAALGKAAVLLAALATVALAPGYFAAGRNGNVTLPRPGEFLALLLFAAAGAGAMASSTDLATFYVGLETATLPLYALAAWRPGDRRSAEAAAKYAVLGGASSALFLFGMSLAYGAAGGLDFGALARAAAGPSDTLLDAGAVFLLAGLGFKLALVPFHMWAPDVYAGSPAPVAAFLSVGSKAAAALGLALLFFGPLDPLRLRYPGLVALLAGASMVAGNLGALRQRELRRFLGYSSIAQAGFLALGFAGDKAAGAPAILYQVFAFGAAYLAVFFVLAHLGGGAGGGEDMSALRGLSRRSPGLAAALLLAMFSLAGIPPLGGFAGKFALLLAAAKAGHYFLVGFALLNSIASLYYYLLVVKEAYIASPDPEPAPARLSRPAALAVAALTLATVALGLWPGVGMALARLSAIP